MSAPPNIEPPRGLADIFPDLASLAPAQRCYAVARAAHDAAREKARVRIDAELPLLKTVDAWRALDDGQLNARIAAELRIEEEAGVNRWSELLALSEKVLVAWGREQVMRLPAAEGFDFDGMVRLAAGVYQQWQKLLGVCMRLEGRPTRTVTLITGGDFRAVELEEEDVTVISTAAGEDATDALLSRWVSDTLAQGLAALRSDASPTGSPAFAVKVVCGEAVNAVELSPAELYAVTQEEHGDDTDRLFMLWAVVLVRDEIRRLTPGATPPTT